MNSRNCLANTQKNLFRQIILIVPHIAEQNYERCIMQSTVFIKSFKIFNKTWNDEIDNLSNRKSFRNYFIRKKEVSLFTDKEDYNNFTIQIKKNKSLIKNNIFCYFLGTISGAFITGCVNKILNKIWGK